MQVFEKLFTAKEIEYFHALKSVIEARENLKTSKKVTFSIKKSDLLESICQKLENFLPRTISDNNEIPLRWIQGDTEPHIDREWNGKRFENTHIVYLSNSQGNLIVDEIAYPIQEGNGYIFQEGLRHETKNTGFEPRLLLGPMSEEIKPVGAPTNLITANGETETIFIRYDSGSGFSYRINENSFGGFSFPLTIINNTPSFTLKVLFETDLVIDNFFYYIICGSENIQFGSTSLQDNGTRPQIIIDGVTNYLGFIQNGTSGGPGSGSGFDKIYVFNLQAFVINGSTLLSGGGWICQAYFGSEAQDNFVINCSSNGIIADNGGGILGQYSGQGTGAILNVIGCSSSGDLSFIDSGGIMGSYCASNGGQVVCKNCSSSGSISGSNCGGIFGPFCADNGGSIQAIKCYSTGNILGTGSGGIFASLTARTVSSSAIAEKCYSRGNTSGLGAGSIYGSSAADSGGTASAVNCYSSGTFSSGNGIFSDPVFVGSGRIQTNCYASNGIWSDVDASSNLTGTPVLSTSPVGDTWVSLLLSSNQPYELNSFGYTPYLLEIIRFNGSIPDLVQETNQIINAGSSTIPAIIPLKLYTIYQITSTSTSASTSASNNLITMDLNTGVISILNTTSAGTYIITLRNEGSYNFTTFTLTVINTGPSPVPIKNLTLSKKKNSFLFNLLFGRRKIRLFDIAIIDVLGTIAIAFAISKRFCIPIQTSLLLMFTAGFTVHELFGVDSKLNAIINNKIIASFF